MMKGHVQLGKNIFGWSDLGEMDLKTAETCGWSYGPTAAFWQLQVSL